MTKTITGGLSHRKSYAVQCLIKGRTNSRGFDNCFEMYDGDDVVMHIMRKALNYNESKLEQAYDDCRNGVKIGGKEWRAMRKLENEKELHDNLKRLGFWDGWHKFYVENV